MPKIWVGRTTLNRQKKGDVLLTKKFGKCKLVILNDVFVDVAVADLKVPSNWRNTRPLLCSLEHGGSNLQVAGRRSQVAGRRSQVAGRRSLFHQYRKHPKHS